MGIYKIAIADRVPLVLLGLTRALERCCEFTIVYSGTDGIAWMEAVRRHKPEIALIDPFMPDPPLNRILAMFEAEKLPTRLVILNDFDGIAQWLPAISDGTNVTLNAISPENQIQTLRHIGHRQRVLTAGGPAAPMPRMSAVSDTSATADLTHREQQIVVLVSKGLSNKEVGRDLDLSEGTIKVHLHHIFQKLAVRNRTALAALTLSHHERNAPVGSVIEATRQKLHAKLV